MEMKLVSMKLKEYLKAEKEVLALYIFGSQAEDLQNSRSDVDLAILLAAGIDKSRYTEYRLRFISELRRFFSPRLDLIILNQVPPLLQFQILKNGKLLFDRDPDARAHLEMNILGRYYDAKRFYEFHFKHLINRIKEEGLGRGYKGDKSTFEEVRRISEKFGSV
jgi:hypothetical protein